jgi:hypothetical protein
MSRGLERIYTSLFAREASPEILIQLRKGLEALKGTKGRDEIRLLELILDEVTDTCALELYLRQKNSRNPLTALYGIVFAISECYASHYPLIVNDRRRKLAAIGVLMAGVFVTPYRYVKGYWLYRRLTNRGRLTAG